MRQHAAGWRVAPRPALAESAVAAAVPDAVQRPSGRLHRVESSVDASVLWPVAFIAVHIPLALAMERYSPTVTTLHAWLTLAVGVWVALSGRLERVAMVVGYIVGAEVLWRMTDAQTPWEYGKYAASAVMLLALLRTGRLKPPILAIGFFILLLPSTILTLSNQPLDVARNQISFNLSGPFALSVCAWFFASVRLSSKQLARVLMSMVGPAVGIAAVAAFGTFLTSDLVFADASNLTTSGGFGPNQVSGILGLGALVTLMLTLDNASGPRMLRMVMAVALVGMTMQSALTFSRGGLYGAAGSAAVALLFASRDARLRSKLLPLVATGLIVGNYFVVPYLNAFTGGEIGVRFLDLTLTGRDRLIRADIALWKDHPILGVGPGEGRFERGMYLANPDNTVMSVQPRAIAAHTEFSRLLSEHGTFGLVALLVFIGAAVANLRRAVDARSRAVIAGLSAWSALFMMSAAMRILAPSFAFGIGFLGAAVPAGEGATDIVGAAPRVRSRARRSLRPLTVRQRPTVADAARVE